MPTGGADVAIPLLGDAIGTTAAGALGTAAEGALIGGGVSAITGGNIGTGALYGGLTGGGASLAGSAIGGAGAGIGGLGSIFGGGSSAGSNLASTAADGSQNFDQVIANNAAAAPSAASTGASVPTSTVANIVSKALGGGNSSGSTSSGLLGNNPLASLGILANGLSSYNTSQANQKALAQQQAQQNQLNQNLYNNVSNFTPLNRQLSVTPQTVGNLNNYGQAGYTGWNGQGGNQLFYNNVNPASYNVPQMKGGGKVNYASGGIMDALPSGLYDIFDKIRSNPDIANMQSNPVNSPQVSSNAPNSFPIGMQSAYKKGGKVNYASGGNAQSELTPTQQYYTNILNNLINPNEGRQVQAPAAQTRQLPDQGSDLANAMKSMYATAFDPTTGANAITPTHANNPMTYNLNSQVYPQANQATRVQAALTGQPYAKGGGVKAPKVKGLQISKTTQLTLPLASQGLSGNLQPQQQLPTQPTMGSQQIPQGLAGGGLPKILDKPQRNMGLPMESMPNRIHPNLTGMMPNRFNPSNPNLNLSPLRMMAQGGALSGSEDGQADTIPARLSDGEYVVPADVISSLGNGNNDAGAKVVDQMVKNIRVHKSVNPPGVKGAKGKLPPKAKPIVQYIKKRKVTKS